MVFDQTILTAMEGLGGCTWGGFESQCGLERCLLSGRDRCVLRDSVEGWVAAIVSSIHKYYSSTF